MRAVSDVYETEPVGGPTQGPYLNVVVELDTDMVPAGCSACATGSRARRTGCGPCAGDPARSTSTCSGSTGWS